MALAALLLAPLAAATTAPGHVYAPIPTIERDQDWTYRLGYQHCPVVSLDGHTPCYHVKVGTLRIDPNVVLRERVVDVEACYLGACRDARVALLP